MERDEVALSGTLTTDLTVGVLGVGDDCMVHGLNLLVCHEVPCHLVLSSALCKMTVHGGAVHPCCCSPTNESEHGPCNYLLPVMVSSQCRRVSREEDSIIDSPVKVLQAIHIIQIHSWVSLTTCFGHFLGLSCHSMQRSDAKERIS